MSKISLNNVVDLQNEQTAVSTINNNSSTIQTAFDNTLSRDGTSPNQMESVLDMNSFNIINLPEPTSNFNPVRLIDLNDLSTGGTITVNPLPSGGSTGQVLTKHSGTDFDVIWANSSSGGSGGIIDYPTRANAIVSLVSNSLNTLRTAGYTSVGDGGAGIYIRLSVAPSPVKAWHFQSADGAWWQLFANPVVPKQVGAKLDGVTDDSIAMQAWLDYGSTFGVTSYGQAGTAAIPTAKLSVSSGAVVDGGEVLTIQRQSNIVDSLLDGTSVNNVVIRGIAFDTTAGTSSVSSNTIGLTTMNFSIPAGLTGFNTYANNFVQITANSSSGARVNYMIGQINSYTGSTMNVTITTINGSGTFSNWLIDSYPQNGNLAQSNIAVRFTSSSGILVENNNVTNRFYNAYDSRNCSNVIFTKNLASGYVNRGIHCAAYNPGGGAVNNQITYNRLVGNSFSQYGINMSATDGGVAAGYTVHGNRIEFSNFQGIIVGGGVTASAISDNTIVLSLNNNGGGIIIEGITGTAGHQLPQNIMIKSNNITLSAQGILVTDALYINIVGNTISGAGEGIVVAGSGSFPTQYTVIQGNTISSSSFNGIHLTGSAVSAVLGTVVSGNISIANGSFGILSDANTTSGNFAGNVSLSNTAGAYSIGGSSNVTSGANL